MPSKRLNSPSQPRGCLLSRLAGLVSAQSEVPNLKHQITNKSQIPISNGPNIFGILFLKENSKVWNFEFRSLLFVCYLGFVICNFHQLPPLHSTNENESSSNSSIPHPQSTRGIIVNENQKGGVIKWTCGEKWE